MFPIVWPLLYIDIATTTAVALDRLDTRHPDFARRYRAAVGLNLVLKLDAPRESFSPRIPGGVCSPLPCPPTSGSSAGTDRKRTPESRTGQGLLRNTLLGSERIRL